MSITSLLGLDMSDPEKAKKAFIKMIGQIRPMMEDRGIKSIVIHFKENGELDLQMLEHCVIKREQELKDYISTLNNKLLNK